MKHPEQSVGRSDEKLQPIVAKTGKALTQQRTGVGAKTSWTYLWKGRPFEWEDITTEWIEDRKISWKTTSSWNMDDSFTLEPIRSGTRVTYEMHYSLPYGFLGQIYDYLRFRGYVHRNLDETLSTLKDAAERIANLRVGDFDGR